jgi:hypothetical protein
VRKLAAALICLIIFKSDKPAPYFLRRYREEIYQYSNGKLIIQNPQFLDNIHRKEETFLKRPYLKYMMTIYSQATKIEHVTETKLLEVLASKEYKFLPDPKMFCVMTPLKMKLNMEFTTEARIQVIAKYLQSLVIKKNPNDHRRVGFNGKTISRIPLEDLYRNNNENKQKSSTQNTVLKFEEILRVKVEMLEKESKEINRLNQCSVLSNSTNTRKQYKTSKALCTVLEKHYNWFQKFRRSIMMQQMEEKGSAKKKFEGLSPSQIRNRNFTETPAQPSIAVVVNLRLVNFKPEYTMTDWFFERCHDKVENIPMKKVMKFLKRQSPKIYDMYLAQEDILMKATDHMIVSKNIKLREQMFKSKDSILNPLKRMQAKTQIRAPRMSVFNTDMLVKQISDMMENQAESSQFTNSMIKEEDENNEDEASMVIPFRDPQLDQSLLRSSRQGSRLSHQSRASFKNRESADMPRVRIRQSVKIIPREGVATSSTPNLFIHEDLKRQEFKGGHNDEFGDTSLALMMPHQHSIISNRESSLESSSSPKMFQNILNRDFHLRLQLAASSSSKDIKDGTMGSRHSGFEYITGVESSKRIDSVMSPTRKNSEKQISRQQTTSSGITSKINSILQSNTTEINPQERKNNLKASKLLYLKLNNDLKLLQKVKTILKQAACRKTGKDPRKLAEERRRKNFSKEGIQMYLQFKRLKVRRRLEEEDSRQSSSRRLESDRSVRVTTARKVGEGLRARVGGRGRGRGLEGIEGYRSSDLIR